MGKPPEPKEERSEKVSSLHIDDVKDAMEEMGTEQVEEERRVFTITGMLGILILLDIMLLSHRVLYIGKNRRKKTRFIIAQ